VSRLRWAVAFSTPNVSAERAVRPMPTTAPLCAAGYEATLDEMVEVPSP